MTKRNRPLQVTVGILALLGGAAASAGQFVPPAGYGGAAGGPGVSVSVEPGALRLTRIANARLTSRFAIAPAYARKLAAARASTPADPAAIAPPGRHDAVAQVRVVGAFAVAETLRSHVVAAWARGFLPVTLAFSDGRCFALIADYTGGTLSNGRLNRVSCDRPPALADRDPPPPDRPLRLIASGRLPAWADRRTGSSIFTVPGAKTFEPLFTARMVPFAVRAMHGIDYTGGNASLVGRIGGRLAVVTVEFNY